MSGPVVETRIQIPALLEHQVPVGLHPARFKVLRKGRRWGKDRLAFNVSWLGHGPDGLYPGILDGWDVAWLAPDYPQARMIWEEELKPRFCDVPDIEVHEKPFYTVNIPGYGALHLRSSENMNSIRGLGKRLIGVVINEAAHLDLSDAWGRIIWPTLTDNNGWAIIMSTTNSGTDGGVDDQGNRRVPSYFNTLCEEIRSGNRDAQWVEFTGTAEENPKIGREKFKVLVAGYPQESIALQEEIYAALLAPGAGLAFPEWRDDLHTLETFTVPKHWQWGAGFDWGYWQPSVLVIAAHGEESQTVVTRERKWVQKDGFEIGQGIAEECLVVPDHVEWIAADSSIWGVEASQKKGFPNMAEEIQSGIFAKWAEAPRPFAPPILMAVPKGQDSRIMRANLLHKYLKWRKHEITGLGSQPRLRFLKSCGLCVTTIPKLPPDPKKPEDVDTKSDDHGYDALTYFLLSRPPLVDAPSTHMLPGDDDHPGLNWPEGTRSRKRFGGPIADEGHVWVPDGRLIPTEV